MNDPEFTKRLGEIFDHAVDLVPEARVGYLDEACADDVILRQRLEELLALDSERDGFMEDPTVDTGESEVDDDLVGTSIGPYGLLEQIGEGGYGVVYLAEQRQPVTRRVALKVIKPGMDTKQVMARFESERQALAMMEHPNIARVLDAGATEQGRPYVVMELVRGVPITTFCTDADLSQSARLHLFTEVCAAVQHAHQKGIIHRDLKPNNILVAMDDDKPTAKIIDFGIAKAMGQKLTEHTLFTQFHQFIGTPAYMSPEQVQLSNIDVDTRADIYALGVLLYELLTSHTPHDTKQLLTKGQEAVFRAIREEDPVRPSTKLTEARKRALDHSEFRLPKSDIAQDLDWVVMKALEKDRSRRYESATAFATDVQRFIAGDPVSAAPPNRYYRYRKWVHRNRGAAVAVAAVLTALATGLGLSFVAFQREQAANARSTEALYASDMKIAQSALKTGDTGLVMEKLESHVPTEGEPDLRGWMWRYLYGQVHQKRVEALRFYGVDAVAIDQSGQVAISGFRDGPRPIELLNGDTLSFEKLIGFAILDARAMRFSYQSKHLIVEQGSIVTCIHLETKAEQLIQREGADLLRLAADEKHLVGLSQVPEETHAKMHVRCYTLNDESPIAVSAESYLLGDRLGMLREFRVSPDGLWVTVSCADQTVRLLSVPDLEEHRSLQMPGPVAAVAWSPDSHVLATAYQFPYHVDLWDVETGQHVGRLGGSSSPCDDLRFSSTGKRLALSNQRGLLHCWDVDTKVQHTLSGKFPVSEFAFYPNGERIVASGKGRVALWYLSSPETSDLERDSVSYELWNVEYSPSGTVLAASAADSLVRLYDPRTGKRLKTLGNRDVTKRPSLGVRDSRLRFSADSRYLLVDNNDNTATLYDVITGEPELSELKLPGDRIEDLSMSPDGQRIAMAGEGRRVIWNRKGEQLEMTRRGPYRRDNLADHRYADLVQFSPDPQSGLIAYGKGNFEVFLQRIDAAEPLSSAFPKRLASLSFSPNGQWLACGLVNGVAVYEVPTLTLVDTVTGSGGVVPNVSFSVDESTLAIPSWGGDVQIWNRRVRAEVGRLIDPGDWVVSATFAPSGDQLAVSTLGSGVHFFEAPTLSEIEASMKAEEEAQQTLAELIRACRTTARQERERQIADDPGAIKEWLWLAALPFQGDPVEALHTAWLPSETTMTPQEGDTVQVGGATFTWRALDQKDYALDFETLLEEKDRRLPRIVYALTYLECERALSSLCIRTGSDDLAKIFLNGDEIYTNDRGWIGRDLDEVGGVSLRQGLNTLVFKIVNSGGVGNGSLRFTTADGGRVDGLRVKLQY